MISPWPLGRLGIETMKRGRERETRETREETVKLRLELVGVGFRVSVVSVVAVVDRGSVSFVLYMSKNM